MGIYVEIKRSDGTCPDRTGTARPASGWFRAQLASPQFSLAGRRGATPPGSLHTGPSRTESELPIRLGPVGHADWGGSVHLPVLQLQRVWAGWPNRASIL